MSDEETEEEKQTIRGVSVSVGSGGIQVAISSRDDDENLDFIIEKLEKILDKYKT